MRGEAPAFYEAMGVRLLPSDSHMHNTVGLVERFNDTFQTMMRAYLFDTPPEEQDWVKFKPYVFLAYNSFVQVSMNNYSPFFLMYHRDPHFPLHLALQPLNVNKLDLDSYSSFVRAHVDCVHAAWHEAREALASSSAKARRRHDATADLSFSVGLGDRVVIKKPESHGLEIPYTGPYRVSEVLDNDRVRIRDLHSIMHDVFHISRLKLYPYVDGDGNLAPEHDEYELHDIVDKRIVDGETEYLVQWRGWNRTHDSWVLAEDLSIAALEQVAAYEAGLRVAEPDGDPSTAHFTASTTDPLPANSTTSVISHRSHHLDAAPPGFVINEQTAPQVVIDHCKSQPKMKGSTTQPSSSAAAADIAPAPYRPELPIDLRYGATAASSRPKRSTTKTTAYGK